MTETIVSGEHLVKDFGSVVAVDDISFDIEEGEFFSLLGPSGCGKTTTLRMIAGFERPSDGTVSIDGDVVNDRPTYDRDTGMVFQGYALFPHKTVGENVGFGLKMDDVPKAEREERVAETLELVNLPGYEDRMPDELSGGQQQRVALARALVIEPSVLLLDEPLSNLDLMLRKQMRFELKRIQRELGITTVYVTHDQEEALSMSDRILVMNEGEAEQIGSPLEIYNEPASEFVADFIGETNLLHGSVAERTNGHVELGLDDVDRRRVRVAADTIVSGDFRSGNEVVLNLRPEDLRLGSSEDDDANVFEGTVREKTFVGSATRFLVAVDGEEILVEATGRKAQTQYDVGSSVDVAWNPDDCIVIEQS
jgi:spermidine/putrescine transport system ATP-binding protein